MGDVKYLVLGANSFYGSNFVKLLREKGEEVVASTERFPVVNNLRWPDCVVNFAAKSLVVESWDNPGIWLQTNVMDTCAIIETARLQDCKCFIHISTPEVYGSSTNWVGEKTAFRPSTPYAVSRACADMMLKAYWMAYKFPMMITRTANIYGPGQQSFRLIPKAFRTLRAGEKFSIHGKGSSLRSFIAVQDACAALYLLSKRGDFGETYHISTEKTHSIKEVVEMICKLLKKDFKESVEFKPDRLGKDHAYLLQTEKIRLLGWEDTIVLEKGLQDYADSTADSK